MRTFILIGRSRKTGKDELICDRTVPITEQLEKRKELASSRVNDEFESVDMVEFRPAKTSLKFITADEEQVKQEKAKAEEKRKEKAKDAPHKNRQVIGGKRKNESEMTGEESKTQTIQQ